MSSSYRIYFQEKYTKIINFLKKWWHPRQAFLSKIEAWKYLYSIELNEIEKRILGISFRTRAKCSESTIHFQFRISPEDIVEDEAHLAWEIATSVQLKLQAHIPNKEVEVTIKISDCCDGNCFECTKYNTENT